jgi:hypothetical protein
VADQQHDVVAQAIGFETGDVLVERAPAPAKIADVAAEEAVQLHDRLGAGVAQRRRAEAAVAVDFGSDALLELAVAAWLDEQGQV